MKNFVLPAEPADCACGRRRCACRGSRPGGGEGQLHNLLRQVPRTRAERATVRRRRLCIPSRATTPIARQCRKSPMTPCSRRSKTAALGWSERRDAVVVQGFRRRRDPRPGRLRAQLLQEVRERRRGVGQGSRVDAKPRDLWWFRKNVPCLDACPVKTDAGRYVQLIAEGRLAEAYRVARSPNPIASICGHACGAPCEDACRRGKIDAPVTIRALKRFLTEQYGPESLSNTRAERGSLGRHGRRQHHAGAWRTRLRTPGAEDRRERHGRGGRRRTSRTGLRARPCPDGLPGDRVRGDAASGRDVALWNPGYRLPREVID